MDEHVTSDVVRAAIQTPDPMMEALSTLLKSVANEAVTGLSHVLTLLGIDPTTMPGEYFAQAVLVEADRAFKPMTRETWIGCYDTYEQVKAVLAANPDLAQQVAQMHRDAADGTVAKDDPLLSGEF